MGTRVVNCECCAEGCCGCTGALTGYLVTISGAGTGPDGCDCSFLNDSWLVDFGCSGTTGDLCVDSCGVQSFSQTNCSGGPDICISAGINDDEDDDCNAFAQILIGGLFECTGGADYVQNPLTDDCGGPITLSLVGTGDTFCSWPATITIERV